MNSISKKHILLGIALLAAVITGYYLFFAPVEDRPQNCLLCEEADERNEHFKNWIVGKEKF